MLLKILFYIPRVCCFFDIKHTLGMFDNIVSLKNLFLMVYLLMILPEYQGDEKY